MHVGYIKTPEGAFLLQLPGGPNGFRLVDDDQSWDFPPFSSWEAVSEEHVPKEEKERLRGLLND